MAFDWRQTYRRLAMAIFFTPIALFILYVVLVVNWSFSDGERVGYLQKFSRKGWLCKTYEGELAMTTMPGVAPVIWRFSVWDPEVARRLDEVVGKKVALHYREYRGIPTSCYGATDYFVDRVEELRGERGRTVQAPSARPQRTPRMQSISPRDRRSAVLVEAAVAVPPAAGRPHTARPHVRS